MEVESCYYGKYMGIKILKKGIEITLAEAIKIINFYLMILDKYFESNN